MKLKLLSLFILTLAVLPSCATTPTNPEIASKADEASAHQPAPFARVALALRGCASCSHCRSTIRQLTKGAAESESVRVGDDDVEVIYSQPQVIPLRQVIDRLSKNGLHDLSLVDVLLDAEGTVRREGSGYVFTLRQTEQSFPLTIPEHAEIPPTGQVLRLRAVVEGWNRDGALSLSFKYLQ